MFETRVAMSHFDKINPDHQVIGNYGVLTRGCDF